MAVELHFFTIELHFFSVKKKVLNFTAESVLMLKSVRLLVLSR